MKNLIPTERIEQAIFLIRGQKVLLDADLALIYGVPTKVLNQAVKRNLRRFPSDFVFRLIAEELEAIQSQIAAGANRSQIVTGSQKHRDPRFLPYAFTEHGAIMAANVLNSRREQGDRLLFPHHRKSCLSPLLLAHNLFLTPALAPQRRA